MHTHTTHITYTHISHVVFFFAVMMNSCDDDSCLNLKTCYASAWFFCQAHTHRRDHTYILFLQRMTIMMEGVYVPFDQLKMYGQHYINDFP